MTRSYAGSELALFASARNWKSYFAQSVARYVGRTVLEVGAGLGANIGYLHAGPVERWVALEPDPAMAADIAAKVASGELPGDCRVVNGTIEEIGDDERFDTILYIDVLEHIADDSRELSRAVRHLAPSGHLVVLSPAHQHLFSPFDESIGHYRRYGRGDLERLTPADCRLVGCRMLDSVGYFASLANRALLRSGDPSRRQIQFWDRVLVPLSRIVDRLTGYAFGKTVIAVWSRR